MATGLYSSGSADLYLEFGQKAITAWSDTEGTGTLNDTRVQRAFDTADAEINRHFLDVGNYVVPLQPQGSDVTTVLHWEVVLAGCWLYFLRGTQDTTEANKFEQLREEVRADMRNAQRNGGRLNAARRWPTPTSPSF